MTSAAAPQVQNTATESANTEELVRTHLPLVGHLVREVLAKVPAHVNRDDLVSAGMLALTLSARSYDVSRAVPFARYASLRIRGALTDELRTMDWASRAVRSRAREVESARNQLAATLGRAPKRAEIAQTMGVSVRDLDCVDADVARASLLSLHGLVDDDCGETFLASSTEGPDELLMRRERVGYLHDALAELPERLRTVVEQYFFGQRKMADIAAELGVTESRVSQLRSEALALLRAGLRAQDGDEQAPAADAAPTGGRAAAARAAYAAAIARRSTLAGRLQATTLLGELRTGVHAPQVRQAL